MNRRGFVRGALAFGIGVGFACVSVFGAPRVAGAISGDDKLVVHTSPQTGLATFVTARDGGPIPLGVTAAGADDRRMGFLRQHGRLFGVVAPDKDLRLGGAEGDALGKIHSTYQQVHRGVPVFSGVLKVHQDANAAVVAANGDFYPITGKLNPTPTLSREAAVAIAQAEIDRGDPRLEQAELTIVDPGWYGDPPAGEHLAYYVILRDSLAGIREAFFIDAHEGAVLDRWSLIQKARYRLVYDAQGTSGDGQLARAEGWAPVDSPVDVNYAYDYAGDVYDFFHRTFGRDSINDAGMAFKLIVNSIAPGCPNAYWDGSQMVFCDGTVTDDITAHEIGHGITQYTANLIYQNQPGQLNESFSDIWGELIDLFNGNVSVPGPPGGIAWPRDDDYADAGTDTPNTVRTSCSGAPGYADGVRWLIGEDADVFGGAIRDMWDPTCFNHPDRAYSRFQTCSPSDYGGVHSGCGIPNHAFAIVTDGKTFNGYTVNGIGAIKAAAVWYRALTVFLTPACDFRDAYYAFNLAAQDLIGTYPIDPRTGAPSGEMFTAADAAEVDKALRAVEMDTDGACGAFEDVLDSNPPGQCSPRTTIFADDFEGGVNGWTVYSTVHLVDTPYDWVQVDDLPYDRPGVGWFCDDLDDGCSGGNESAKHTLTSPAISLPMDLAQPTLAFTHYVATEPGWDGGNLRIKVDDEDWQLVPDSAFTYNPYNTRLLTQIQGSTNPMGGQRAWSGAGGRWGTTLMDLSGYVSGGETVQFRFDFGKDYCNGLDGWYVDDFEVYQCPSIAVLGSNPPNGAIDARQPHPLRDAGDAAGWTSIEIAFENLTGAPPGEFAVTEVGGDGFAPTVVNISNNGLGGVTLPLSEPLEPNAWTVISHDHTGWTGCFGYLPGDADGDGLSSSADIQALINSINGVPGGVLPKYSTDANRSGATNAHDILRLIDLLNGAAAFQPWLGEALPANPCD